VEGQESSSSNTTAKPIDSVKPIDSIVAIVEEGQKSSTTNTMALIKPKEGQKRNTIKITAITIKS
jgi:hypothetical protein